MLLLNEISYFTLLIKKVFGFLSFLHLSDAVLSVPQKINLPKGQMLVVSPDRLWPHASTRSLQAIKALKVVSLR